MIFDAALRSRSAIARILTSFVDAGKVERTLVVGGALWSLASDERISSVAVQAVATGAVEVVRSTEGVAAALHLLARLDAVLVDTLLARRTVVISPASN